MRTRPVESLLRALPVRQTVIGVFRNQKTAALARERLELRGFVCEWIQATPLSGAKAAAMRMGVAAAARRWPCWRTTSLLDTDLGLSPFAEALARGDCVVKVHVASGIEADAAQELLVACGAGMDLLADDWTKRNW